MENTTDLKAFNQLFTDYQGRFIRFANTYVRDIAVAEDFTIEALMYYWENRHSLEKDSNVPAYILTIIKKQMPELFAAPAGKRRCQRTITESCRMGTEYPHIDFGSL